MDKIGAALFLLLALLAAPAWCVAPATVDSVQMPAWLDRGEAPEQPLAPGMEVRDGDRLRTGSGARAYLKLANGSMVKLGDNATLGFHSLSPKPQSSFKGTLDVLNGAFRFTTAALRRGGDLQLDIHVGTATAGIRGTDLWGKSDAVRDVVCLIEGRIELEHAGQVQVMDQPSSYFSAPRAAPALPVALLDGAELQRWARETEILPGDGAARHRGKWKVLLGRADNETDALALYDLARHAGYAARVRPRAAAESGKWTYEILLAAFADAKEAAVLARKAGIDLGLSATVLR